jgi:hypothetical protein
MVAVIIWAPCTDEHLPNMMGYDKEVCPQGALHSAITDHGYLRLYGTEPRATDTVASPQISH